MHRVGDNAGSRYGFLSLALIIACSCLDASFSNAQQPPNVVLIVADDYGFADVGYRGSAIKTPNLDRLANTGVILDNYYVQPLCTPTRSQLLAGRYQIHTGLQHFVILACQPNGLPPEFPTIADKLKEQGYATHIVGKWHLGYYQEQLTPLYRGFDSFFGFYTAAAEHYTHIHCTIFGSASDGNGTRLCGLDLRDGLSPARNYTGRYSTHMFAEKAVDVIKEHAVSNNEKPLFLYLPFQALHSPTQVPDEYKEPYSNITDRLRRTYAGMISCLDEAVGNVTDALEKNGLWNNTVLIFSTDNGGQALMGGNNWPLRGWKASLWEGGMRGVGFVNSPLIKQPGTINTGLIHVSDWFPTLLKLAGGNTTGLDLDGFDVWETISEGADSPRVELLHSIDLLTPLRGSNLNISNFDNRIAAAIRVGNWKLITGNPENGSWVAPPEDPALETIPDPDPEEKNIWLFDLSKDPTETTDVFQENQDIAVELLNRLEYYNSIAVPARFPDDDPLCDPDLHDGVWSPWV